MAPQVGQVVNNKYRLFRQIGDGGMGTVFEARHEALGTTVALKFLHLELTRQEGLVQRFVQEARVVAQIQSPHVVRVIDVDQAADGHVFIVLEHLEGKTLQALYEELYRNGQRLSYADALDYGTQILDGVEAAHRVGVVHRDLKPDNVMITRDPSGAAVLKLLDFGIAKLKTLGAPGLTRPGVMMGTPEYMAPEQASSADAVDVRADVFSLGVILYEMIAGRRPALGDTAATITAAYLSGQIPRLTDMVPGLSPELGAIVSTAMAARPHDRFATVAAFRRAIEPFAQQARPPATGAVRPGTIGVTPGTGTTPSSSPGSASPGAPAIPKTLPPDSGASAPSLAGTLVDSGIAVGSVNGTLIDPSCPASFGSTAGMSPGPGPKGSGAGAAIGGGFGVGYGSHAYGSQGGASGYGAGQNPGSPMPYARPPGRARPRQASTALIVGASAVIIGTTATVIGYIATRPNDDGPETPMNLSPPVVPRAPTGNTGSSKDPPKPIAVVPPVEEPPGPAPPSRRGPRIPSAAPTAPTGPAPRPSGSGAPVPVPSAASPDPFILPSTLPFPNPFQVP
jgi:serine/threonine-protein kinase